MSVRSSVQTALDELGAVGWERELALALADRVDEDGQAAAAKELRTLMTSIGAELKTSQTPQEIQADELRAKREARRAEAVRAKVPDAR